MTPDRERLSPQTLLALFGATMVAIVVAVLAIDRPVARFSHDVLRVAGKEQWYFVALTDIPDVLPALAGIVFAIALVQVLRGVELGHRMRTLLQVAIVLVVAIMLKEQLKMLTGRTWPETWTNNNPSYTKDGVFGFFWLKPLLEKTGRAYLAFPSGHMTIIAAACTSLALVVPRLRWVAPIPVALVAIGMIGANYHWVSDLIGGTALGAAVALAGHRLAQASKT
jgi:membrane-associated phospholipid phosphatase